MKEDTQYFQCIMLYYFKKGKKQVKHTHKKICAVCGGGVMSDRLCQKWFVKFPGTVDILAK